ncbi:Mov34/MPN/PAD-1 [Arcticibacter svalbardensis MN12-7]|uniref:Mov34/MPN/PAD-1 n=1 Tax=Arcticibacter svalbardensis MN12-7 TaxID=1150600 RepID=R9GSN5_9SPHI|nr:M67 family metallopeptidase [Arcticibacter svalbardensis]EOR94877.1 Mov34/MPN/PAD-1 [Arcticibacter svalbardensis MN12-7]
MLWFFFGLQGAREDDVKVALEVKNDEGLEKHRYFKINPYDYMKAEQYAEENNLALLGIYHSHPNQPALPSPDDKQFALPNISYLIISVSGKDILEPKCWQLDEEQIFQEQIIETLI